MYGFGLCVATDSCVCYKMIRNLLLFTWSVDVQTSDTSTSLSPKGVQPVYWLLMILHA